MIALECVGTARTASGFLYIYGFLLVGFGIGLRPVYHAAKWRSA